MYGDEKTNGPFVADHLTADGREKPQARIAAPRFAVPSATYDLVTG